MEIRANVLIGVTRLGIVDSLNICSWAETPVSVVPAVNGIPSPGWIVSKDESVTMWNYRMISLYKENHIVCLYTTLHSWWQSILCSDIFHLFMPTSPNNVIAAVQIMSDPSISKYVLEVHYNQIDETTHELKL